MRNRSLFSLNRFWAIVVKEFVQMRRDRLTFGMMIGIPLIQLILFGLVINSDPKHLPTAVVLADRVVQPYFNLPAMLIIAAVTVVLVIGIRESALTNTIEPSVNA